MSTLSLAKNGCVSSSKRTKHIKAKYFFIRHYHNAQELDLRYCPTEQLWADVLTKPLRYCRGCTGKFSRLYLSKKKFWFHVCKKNRRQKTSQSTIRATPKIGDFHFRQYSPSVDVLFVGMRKCVPVCTFLLFLAHEFLRRG